MSPLIGLVFTLSSEKVDLRATATPQARKLITQGERKFRNKDYGGAIQSFLKVFAVQPFAPNTNFHLGRFYSISKKREEAFKHLTLAIEQGFDDFTEIKSSRDLEFLKNQPEFREYAQDSYKLLAVKVSSDDVITKLEKLGRIKSNGLLTEEEYTEQKKKLLSS